MIAHISLDTTVGQLVTERPGRALFFERLGIDYCCGGRLPLREASERRGLDPGAVRDELAACDTLTACGAIADAEDPTDWSQASMSDLVDHIVTVHHGYVKEALPRLASLTAKVARAHGTRHPELQSLQEVVNELRTELEAHMAKEEQVLFPICRTLETARTLSEGCCGSVNNPIRRMTREHEDAGNALDAVRRLTDDFTPPEDACNTYRALLDGLAEFEQDMHRHVHKENNILFPRAVAAEAALAGAA